MSTLKPKQQQAAILLLEGKSGKEVAEIIGVTPESISHWKSDPHFIAFMNHLQHKIMNESLVTLRRTAGKAADKLEDLIDNAESESTNLRDCIAALQMLNFDNHEKLAWRRLEIGHTDPQIVAKKMAEDNSKIEDK